MKLQSRTSSSNRIVGLTILVGALGYFVDIYDMILFGIVRESSLRDIGVSSEQLLSTGIHLINFQMAGLLIGGIVCGVIGDKFGRVKALFFSIFLYSIANLANAYVDTISQYAILRGLAGIGLAGELGLAVTLVSERMSNENRGYGTTFIAVVGLSGAVVGGLVGELVHWRTAYIIGGVLGLILLLTRLSIFESDQFRNMRTEHISRGNFFLIFETRQRMVKYLACILIVVPIQFIIGILVVFSPEISRELGITGPISAGKAIMFCYIGLVVGDIISGLLSQYLKSRRKILFLYLTTTSLSIAAYCSASGITPNAYYGLCGILGFGAGYVAISATIVSEQFGTDLRATATTTVPNFARGALVLITTTLKYLTERYDIVSSALMIGTFIMVCAFFAFWKLNESFAKDLNFLESTIKP